MRITPENFVKVAVMAILGIAIARMASAKLGIPGLSALVD